MYFHTLNLSGHVHDRPWQNINHFYSAPRGMTFEEMVEKINSFSKAFTLKAIEAA